MSDKFEKFIILLIILNLFIFVFSTVDCIYAKFCKIFYSVEIFSVFIFTIEYVFRIFSLNSIKDIFKPILIIDFLAIAPFYLSFININTIFLRIFRLSRLIRILKINRYTQALDNIIKSVAEKKEEFIITFVIFLVSVLFSGILMYYAEHSVQPKMFSSIPRACYFSIITFTTVGFGDFSPITDLGRIITSIMAVLGICFHGLLVGVIGATLIKALGIKND